MLARLIAPILLLALPAAARAKPLELWIMPNGANPEGVIEETLSGFKGEAGLDVHVTVLDWGEAWSRISAALDAGQGPDVLQLGTTWVSRLASQGKLAPLDAHVSAIRPKRFLGPLWATTQVDGDASIYAVPWLVDVRVLVGNRRWLSQLGITAADVTTVEGFRSALAKVRDAHPMRDGVLPIYPLAIAGKSDWNLPHNAAPWIWSQGGDFIGKVDGRWRSRLLDRDTIVGLRRYLGFALDGLVNPTCLREDNTQVSARFINGEQVFAVPPSEVILQARVADAQGGTLRSRVGKEGVLTMPIPAGRAGSIAFVGGTDLAIPRVHAKSAGALKLLLFLTRSDNIDKYAWPIGLPADRDVMVARGKDPLYSVLAEQLEKGRSYPTVPVWEDVEALLVDMLSAIWTLADAGGHDIDDELYAIVADHSRRIDKVLGIDDSRPAMTLADFRDLAKAMPPLPHAGAAGKPASDGHAIVGRVAVWLALLGLAVLAALVALRRTGRS